MSIIYTIYTTKQNARNIEKWFCLKMSRCKCTSILPFAILPPPPTSSQCLGCSSYSMKKEAELWEAKPAYQVTPPGNTTSSVAQPLIPEYSPSNRVLCTTPCYLRPCRVTPGPRRQEGRRMDRQTIKSTPSTGFSRILFLRTLSYWVCPN